MLIQRGEEPRDIESQIELTSRVQSKDLSIYLKRLEHKYTHDEHVDIVLASNMISVGIDVSRLGLMVVLSQPISMSDYIQSTSRVGRDANSPGLILTIYNNSKVRDRSRFESFSGWHQSFYREVEASSVTPFAPRARDKALHAPFVAMIRHLIPNMANPNQINNCKTEIEEIKKRVIDRISRIDADECKSANDELIDFFENWNDWDSVNDYWQDFKDALLMSAELAAETNRRGRDSRQKPTPNSLRTVEASVKFTILNESIPRRRQRREQTELELNHE